MFGDIIYVERKPLLWKSVEKRANPNSKESIISFFVQQSIVIMGLILDMDEWSIFKAIVFGADMNVG